MMHRWPPNTLYETLHKLPVPGSPYWMYDGQFIWIPMPQMGYERWYATWKATKLKLMEPTKEDV